MIFKLQIVNENLKNNLLKMLLNGIKKEFLKEGKIFNE